MNNLENMISLSTAGGGKTTRLIQRIEEIILNGGSKNRILVISFTNSSCEDIFQRCGIKAETLHSFCYRFLPSKYTIEEDISKFTNIFLSNFFNLNRLGETLVNRLVNSYFIFQNFPKDLIDNADNSSLENYSALSPSDLKLNLEFRELIKQICKEKENHNCLFFSDIIHQFLNGLDDFLLDIFQQYDHILVDEAQDLSELQLKILSTIIDSVFLNENKSFFIVGDVKQSIYDFQGSSPTVYLQFIEELKNVCKQKKIDLVFEKNDKTYRFGGEILTKINEKFSNHESHKTEGKYIQIAIDEDKDIEKSVINIVEKHLENTSPEEIMILFERTNKTIENLQNLFDGIGLNIKIYTQNNLLIESLKDIVGFLQTESNWYAAKILQGPFFHLSEPHFYLLSQSIGEDYTLFNKDFFEQIKSLRDFPDLLITFLCKSTVYLNSIDTKLLNALYSMSFAYTSIDSLMINLPETIKLKQSGIKFSTVHSSKGLEAEVVILIPQKKRKETLTINLNPFCFFLDDINDFTKFIKEKKFKSTLENANNLYYVAMTRSKQYLYEISFGYFF